MHVRWDPENGEAVKTWEFDPGIVTRKQATQMEKYFGGSWDQFIAGLMTGQIQARAVLLWFMMAQVHDKIRFEDVPDFRVRQLTVEMGVAELQDLWKRAQRIKLDPDQREAFEDQFAEDMKDALKREGRDPDDFRIDGKRLELGSAELPKQA